MTFNTKRAALTTLGMGVALFSTINVVQAASLSVALNQSRIISLSEPASTFVIGNPAIADANFASPTKVLILGKAYGATNLIALDEDGKVILNTNLHVVSSKNNRVSLFKGGAKQSYDCYGDCVPTMDPGDDTTVLGALVKSTQSVQGLAQSAAEGGAE